MSEEVKPSRSELIIKANELFNKGSRNYFLKCYNEAVDDLSEACALYEEIYGEFSNELGMPYLLYAKSLIAIAYEENKVVEISEADENEEDEDEPLSDSEGSIIESQDSKHSDKCTKNDENVEAKDTNIDKEDKADDSTTNSVKESKGMTDLTEQITNSINNSEGEVEAEEDEASSNLQVAWEILELASKIFSRQGLTGLQYLAEVQTELANIEFENNIPDSAREDYEKALKIYNNLNNKSRRTMAEIHYKIGLTYLMQQMNQEASQSLKNAYDLIEEEINELKTKENQSETYIELKDMEETKIEIGIKISEIEETTQQNIADVRAVFKSYQSSNKTETNDTTVPSSSGIVTSSIKCSPKPMDITHLIKRKKSDVSPSSQTEENVLPAKKKAF